MNKGSFTQFVKGNTAHRFPKVVALAISSSVLVAMIAIDASASPNATSAISSPPTHSNVLATESILSQVFGNGHHHKNPPTTSPTTTTTTAPVAPSGGGGGGGGGVAAVARLRQPQLRQPQPHWRPPRRRPTPSTPSNSPSDLIQAGPSRNECAVLSLPSGRLRAHVSPGSSKPVSNRNQQHHHLHRLVLERGAVMV